MRPALFESQDSAGRFVLNAEESKSHGRKWLTDAACCGNIWIPRTSQAGLTGNTAKRRMMLQLVCPIAVFRKKSNRREPAFLGFGIDLSGGIGYYKKRTDVHYLEVRNGD